MQFSPKKYCGDTNLVIRSVSKTNSPDRCRTRANSTGAPKVKSTAGIRNAIADIAESRPAPTMKTPTGDSQSINEENRQRYTLRGLLKFQGRRGRRPDSDRGSRAGERNRQAVLYRRDELRVHLGRAHETLAIAMNRLGGKSNTGRRGRRSGPLPADCPTAIPTPSARRSNRLRRGGSA